MDKWRNEAGEELFVPAHMLLDCKTLLDERRQWCIGGFAWIPCWERTPTVPEDYLVVREVNGQRVVETAQWNGAQWVTDGGYAAVLHGVTHWMALPLPPKEPAEPKPGG